MQAGLCAPQAWAGGWGPGSWALPCQPMGVQTRSHARPQRHGGGRGPALRAWGADSPLQGHRRGGPGPKAVTGRDAPLLAGDG